MGRISIDQLRKQANRGVKYSQFLLAERLFDGDEVSQDYKEAFHWYAQAAKYKTDHRIKKDLSDLAIMDAWYKLGVCYQEGLGVEKNNFYACLMYMKCIVNDPQKNISEELKKNAIEKYREIMPLLIEQENSEDGQKIYESVYVRHYNQYEKFFQSDTNNTVYNLYMKSAEKGNVYAMYEYGLQMARIGDDSSIEWLKKSAFGGCAAASFELGEAYIDGDIFKKVMVEKKPELGIKYFKKTTEMINQDRNLDNHFHCVNAFDRLGWYYKRKGEYELASYCLLRTLDENDNPLVSIDSKNYSALGEISLSLGNREQAEMYYNKGIEYNGNIHCSMGLKELYKTSR